MKGSLTQSEINKELLMSALKTKATLVILTKLLVKTHSIISNENELALLQSISEEILDLESQLYSAVFDA